MCAGVGGSGGSGGAAGAAGVRVADIMVSGSGAGAGGVGGGGDSDFRRGCWWTFGCVLCSVVWVEWWGFCGGGGGGEQWEDLGLVSCGLVWRIPVLLWCWNGRGDFLTAFSA